MKYACFTCPNLIFSFRSRHVDCTKDDFPIHPRLCTYYKRTDFSGLANTTLTLRRTCEAMWIFGTNKYHSDVFLRGFAGRSVIFLFSVRVIEREKEREK